MGRDRLTGGGVVAMVGRFVLFLCREWSEKFGSRKVGKVLAMKLHPNLI